MIDKEKLLKVFNRPEEKLLLSKVLDQADLCLRYKEPKFTDFMPPEIMSYMTGLKENGLFFKAYGGNEACERKLLSVYPEFYELEDEDFPICALKISHGAHMGSALSHRDYLGAILGTGVKRDKIGDIFVLDTYAFCFVKDEIAEYLCYNLIKAGRLKADVSKVPLGEVFIPQKEEKALFRTIASMRLDVFLDAAFSVSRGTAKALITSEKVMLNHKTEKNPSKEVKKGDMISVRGLGRALLFEVSGETKKGRIRIIIKKPE